MPDRTSPKRLLAACEILLVFAVFAIQGAWPVPDVNEPYYLGKAIHFWNPTWAEGDFFLQTADSHEVFYFTFGWLSQWLTPLALAWTGRLVTWALLAWSWRRLSWALLPRWGLAVLSAALFACLQERCHMAGEWVIGGVEAKGFAFVLVFLGLEAMVRGRWNRTWLLFGAASSFHVLVGGWAVVAALLAWASTSQGRPKLGSMALALVGGFLLSLPGLVPALRLTAGADPQTVALAHEIYVYKRLAHHLAPAYIPATFVFRFVGLVGLWILMEWVTPAEETRRRLRRFVGAAVGIAVAGMAINLFVPIAPVRVAGLLRFYWFRLSDVAVPLGAAMVAPPFIAWWTDEARRWWPDQRRRRRWVVVGVLALGMAVFAVPVRLSPWGALAEGFAMPWSLALEAAVLLLGGLFWLGVWSLPLSQADRRVWAPAPLAAAVLLAAAGTAVHLGNYAFQRTQPTIPRADRLYQYARPEDRVRDYLGWREACRWVATSGQIPRDARFLTPRVSQTFKWYAGRPEVVNWKEMPQDAESLVEWWTRLRDVYGTGSDQPGQQWYPSLAEVGYWLGPQRLRELGRRYDARYVITAIGPPVYGLEAVYWNDMYVVYDLDAPAVERPSP